MAIGRVKGRTPRMRLRSHGDRPRPRELEAIRRDRRGLEAVEVEAVNGPATAQRLRSRRLTSRSPLPHSPTTPRPVSEHRREAPEQDDGVDALAALLVPVVVGEVEPEGELVERQRGGEAGGQRRGARRRAVLGVCADRHLPGPEVAERDLADDPGRRVVQVAPAGAHVAEGAAPVADRVGDDPAAGEADREADGVQEGTLPLRVRRSGDGRRRAARSARGRPSFGVLGIGVSRHGRLSLRAEPTGGAAGVRRS